MCFAGPIHFLVLDRSSFSILGCPYPAHPSASFCVLFRPLSMLVHSCIISFFGCFHPFYDCIYPILSVSMMIHSFSICIDLCPCFFLPCRCSFILFCPCPSSFSIFSVLTYFGIPFNIVQYFLLCVCVCNMCQFVSQLPAAHQGREK